MIYKTNSGYGVNFNQLAAIRNSQMQGSVAGIYCTRLSDGGYRFTGTGTGTTIFTWNDKENIRPIPAHKYYIKIIITDYESDSVLGTLVANGFGSLGNGTDSIYTAGGNAGQTFYTYWGNGQRSDQTMYVMQTDLTVMFGSGYEPTTVAQFKEMYDNPRFDYISSQWQWAKKGKITAYPTPCFGVDFNQLVQNGNFVNDSGWFSVEGTKSISNNEAILTPSSSAAYPGMGRTIGTTISGHRYLVFLQFKGENKLALNCGGLNAQIVSGLDIANYNNVGYIFTSTASNTNFTFFVVNGRNSQYYKNVCLFDLTQMYGEGNEPATVEEFRSKFPDDYYPYTLSEMRYIDEKTSYTLLPIEHHIVGLVEPELSDISLLKLKTGSYKNTGNQGPYVEVKEGNEIVINTPSTSATYGVTLLSILSEITLKAGHTYYCFLDGQRKSGDWNAITIDYTGGGGPVSYFLYVGNVNTITLEADKTISSVRAFLNSTSTHYDNYSVKLIITENRQYLIDKGLITV